jgi:hypothetical protein
MAFDTAFAWGRWLEADGSVRRGAGLGRRLHVRYVCDLLCLCKPSASAEPHVLATLVNVSRAGVGLLVNRPFGKGAVISVQAPIAGGNLLACVTHVVRRPDGRRFLGCVFINELSPDDLRGFWNTEVHEQRCQERLLCEAHGWYRVLGDRKSPRRRAMVFDISALGAFLVTERRVREGSVLRLELRTPGRGPIKTLAYAMRTEILTNQRWTCGCSFLRQLNHTEIRAILSLRG